MRRRIILIFSVAVTVASFICGFSRGQDSANPFAKIGHIVVIYTENRSFDHIFGLFPNAEGLASSPIYPQVDADGAPLPFLPRPASDLRLPEKLPNAPFPIDAFVLPADSTADPTHDFYIEQEQIDGGKMDRFVEASNAGALVMAYYDGRKLKLWALAKEFTLADHFFHAAFGGSFLNHFYLMCACAPVFPKDQLPPLGADALMAKVDPASGWLVRAADSNKSVIDGPPHFETPGRMTSDLFVVGTMAPFQPVSAQDAKAEFRLPPQSMKTIGDLLDDKTVDWAWYAGGWERAASGKVKSYTEPDWFQTHHQPLLYFGKFAAGAPDRDKRMKDAEAFFKDAAAGTLPPVSFYKPLGRFNGHSGYSDISAGDEHLSDVVAKLRASPNWSDMLVIITADENGGYWDHVAPPKIDRFGPGLRVPTLILSPFAKKGFVDHTLYDTTSILRTIEVRFGLAPLGSRDAAANDLRNALE